MKITITNFDDRVSFPCAIVHAKTKSSAAARTERKWIHSAQFKVDAKAYVFLEKNATTSFKRPCLPGKSP
jgi:hypothetical protein